MPSEASDSDHSHPVERLSASRALIAASLLLGATLYYATVAVSWHKNLRFPADSTVQGVITGPSTVRNAGRRSAMAVPSVPYEYRVEGKLYSNDQVPCPRPFSGASYLTRARALQGIEALSVGSPVTVYYRNTNPAIAGLSPALRVEDVFPFSLLIAFSGFVNVAVAVSAKWLRWWRSGRPLSDRQLRLREPGELQVCIPPNEAHTFLAVGTVAGAIVAMGTALAVASYSNLEPAWPLVYVLCGATVLPGLMLCTRRVVFCKATTIPVALLAAVSVREARRIDRNAQSVGQLWITFSDGTERLLCRSLDWCWLNAVAAQIKTTAARRRSNATAIE